MGLLVFLFQHLSLPTHTVRPWQGALISPQSVSDIVTGSSKDEGGRMAIPGDSGHLSLLGPKSCHRTPGAVGVPQVDPLVTASTGQIPVTMESFSLSLIELS